MDFFAAKPENLELRIISKKQHKNHIYWFDKAVDNGAAEVAQKDRDGILNAYRTNFSSTEFYELMQELSAWCSVGSDDVPKDMAKAAHWREVGENRLKGKA